MLVAAEKPGTILMLVPASRGARQMIFLPESKHKGVNQRSKYVTQVQQRPESPTVTITWHVCKYKVHKLHQRYSLMFFSFLFVCCFFSQSNFQCRLSYGVRTAPVCKRTHRHNYVRKLNIPNTSSQTIVWTHENTAHTGSNG